MGRNLGMGMGRNLEMGKWQEFRDLKMSPRWEKGRNLGVPAVGKRWEFRDRNGQEFRDGNVSLRWEKGRNLGVGMGRNLGMWKCP